MSQGDRDRKGNSAKTSTALTGSRLAFREADAGVFELVFTGRRVRWKCVEGEFEGESGSAPYKAVHIDRNTLLIVWSQPSGEAAVIVAKPGEGLAHVCHVYGEECDIAPAEVLRWSSAEPRASARRRTDEARPRTS